MAEPFSIDFTATALTHLEEHRKYDSSRILDAIKEQLTYQPSEETRNRKLLRENPVADWELRVDNFRVFYEIRPEEQTVRVVAVGHKENNKLFLGGEEVEI